MENKKEITSSKAEPDITDMPETYLMDELYGMGQNLSRIQETIMELKAMCDMLDGIKEGEPKWSPSFSNSPDELELPGAVPKMHMLNRRLESAGMELHNVGARIRRAIYGKDIQVGKVAPSERE